ncbi:MAG: hypothetical protein AAFQ68_20560 [Bacteroidota bacterium]
MLQRIAHSLILASLISFTPTYLQAQTADLLQKWKFKPIVGIQLWGSHSNGGAYFEDSLQQYLPLDHRLNVEIRRTRVGFSVQPMERLSFRWVSALDNMGRDVYSGLNGGANNGAFPNLGIWDCNLQWQCLPDQQSLFLTTGYFGPHLGRESFTSAFNVTSLEKSWSQNYVRRHLVGTGPGRTLGVNLGGQFYEENRFFNFSYNLGGFSPLLTGAVSNTSGRQAAALWVGHATLHFGEPESPTYSRGHRINYFGKRRGLSIGFGGSHQDRTDLFTLSQSTSADFLFNYDALNLDGSLTYLWRENEQRQRPEARVLHLRASINFYFQYQGKQRVLEPMILLTDYQGEMQAEGQAVAASVGMLTGLDRLIDIGFNYYLTPKFKFGLHYHLRRGSLGEAKAGSPINNYYFQGGAGPIQRPNWLGFGVQLQL